MSEARARSLQTDPRLPHQVEVIDCTLRDGEQAHGVWFTIEDKLSLATALSRAGIAVLDAGFPGSSASEVEALQAIHDLALPSRIAATARPIVADIKAAAEPGQTKFFFLCPQAISG
jgi:isopropylmalate/homocitrate/citramalate synthase